MVKVEAVDPDTGRLSEDDPSGREADHLAKSDPRTTTGDTTST